MAKINADGWLEGATIVPSPNCDERPSGTIIDLLVIHNISLPPSQFGGPYIEALFTNQLDPKAHPFFAEINHLTVSAHALIRRDGNVVQFVPFGQRAWHAGESNFDGRDRCNDFSIGIELEGDDFSPFTLPQYRTLAALTGALQCHYPAISNDRITGHSDIAPNRKTDPGPYFMWPRFLEMLQPMP